MSWTAGSRVPAFSGRPIIALAGQPTPTGDIAAVAATAREAGLHAVDLDLSSSLVPPRWRDDARTEWDALRVRTCWLPATVTGPFARRRAAAILAFLRCGRDEVGLRTIVLPRSAPKRGVPMAATVRELTAGISGTPVRMAVAVNAATLSASPSQRTALQSIRRMAEEWDLDIALDLCVATGSAWEAEAAVLRLLPRLRLVRLPCRTEDVADAGARIVDRTVAMLADQGYGGTFSLMPPSSWLLRPHQSRDAALALAAQRDIIARYDHIARDLPVDPRLRHLPGGSEQR